MAFHGDFSSFPLPELLQWLDASRKTGTLQLSWDAGDRKLFVLAGQVVATAGPSLWERLARTLELGRLASGQEVLGAFAQMRASGDASASFAVRGLSPALVVDLARDELYGAIVDLTLAGGGRFHWTEDPDRAGEEWVPAELSLRQLLFESLRWVDENPDVERALPLDSMVVRAAGKGRPDLPLLMRIVLDVCERGHNLGKLRFAMGLPRSTLTRRVFDLLKLGLVEVDGAPQVEVDPVAEMLEKGAMLLREGQHEAAGLVCASLLLSDPADRRVRELAHAVQAEHVASLYRELPPIAIPELHEDAEALSRLRPEERHVAALVNGRWDVSTIVLASHARELETLKALRKLSHLGLLTLGSG